MSQEDPLDEGMATHSSILAWRIPWTEVPGGLQSMGLQRAGYSWSNLAHRHFMLIEIIILNGAMERDSTYKPIWEKSVISKMNKLLTSRCYSLADLRGFKTILRNLWGLEVFTSLIYTVSQLDQAWLRDQRLLILSGSFWGCTNKVKEQFILKSENGTCSVLSDSLRPHGL